MFVLDEPRLQFSNGQFAVDPHDGLALFGPYSLNDPGTATPTYLSVGPSDGLRTLENWCQAMNSSFATSETKRHRLWPPFPGFEVAFGSKWSTKPAASVELGRELLLEASRKKDPHERCFAVVEHYMAAMERTRKLDEKIAVALCVVPDEVWANCRPRSRVLNPSDAGLTSDEKQARLNGQGNLFEDINFEQYRLSPDFRRQLKARTMGFDIPVQIIRESTLRLSDENPFGERGLTPVSDRMWNLGASLYYKAGGKPWKLNSAREGVCYIGIAFRLTGADSRTACCAAQMFLDSGDGIVFLGQYGPWYSPENEQFHLSRIAAKNLLKGVLETYADREGKPLKEIFLHCRSSLGRDEFAGFKEACPSDCKLVAVRVRHDSLGPRLYRTGTMPVLRGTFLKLDDRSGLLYASGFKPRLATYDGAEVPVPLRIDVQHGEAPIVQVAQDIFALTKLNYNACKLGDGQPVTVKFSDAVGEILISNPTIKETRPNFKFYI